VLKTNRETGMEDEYTELLDTAIYKEIASEAFYTALKEKTGDPGASVLMGELAEEEKKHVRWLTDFKDQRQKMKWHRSNAVELKIGEYLTAPENLEGAGLQDTLVFAIKREQQSVDFYSRMTGLLRARSAKTLCRKLAGEELRHKIRIEVLYDDLFLYEN
jgi:rubrerythrin